MIQALKKELKKGSDPAKAEVLQKFFKTGPGEYGESDIFIGLTVGDIRKITKKYNHLKIKEITGLMSSKIHEERLAAILILIERFQQNENQREKIYQFYLKNIKYVNNWDLVDMSADKIIGTYLLDKPKNIIFKLAKSKNIWQRRIAVIATFQLIKNNRFRETLKISKILLKDKHDLIHKSVGWMLREVGKRDQILEEKFLDKYGKEMPRTMLRYAIEKLPEKKRLFYLEK